MMQRSDPELNSVPHARRAWTGSTLPGQIPLSSVGDFLAVNQHVVKEVVLILHL